MVYRPDIDGLRAIAIGTVVLFHLGFPGLPGGFIGVDVFFVISGYLITGLLMQDIDRNSFSLLRFYERRIKRILPALLLMLTVVTGLGALFLLPAAYTTEATSAMYAVVSASNIFFLENTSYFDAASDTMPLLHTWTLAVEEQFYLIWPLSLFVLATIMRRSRLLIAAACMLIAVCSFAWSVHLVGVEPKRAFYGADARAWELAIGAVIAIVPSNAWPRSPIFTNVAGLVGICLIGYGTAYFTKETPFPGINALFPAIGAALILIPWPSRNWIAGGLSLAPFVLLGKISYSLYLWHWPIIVLFEHYNLNIATSWTQNVALLILMLPISWASWYFVENPVRRMKLPSLETIGAGVIAAIVVVTASVVVVDAGGFPGRLPESARGMQSLNQMWEWNAATYTYFPEAGYFKHGYYTFGAPWETASKKAFLWGDSHAEHLAPLLEPFAKKAAVSVFLYRECPPIIDATNVNVVFPSVPSYSRDCGESRRNAIQFLHDHKDIDYVILTSSWTALLYQIYKTDPSERSLTAGAKLLKSGLDSLVPMISAAGRQIILVGDVPQWSHDPIPCAIAEVAGKMVFRACSKAERDLPSNAALAYSAAEYGVLRSFGGQPNLSVYLPDLDLCHDESCITTLNDEFLYRDGNHLRRNLRVTTRIELAKFIHLDTIFSSSTQPVIP